MSHIFVAYSRRDIDFAEKIVQALADNKLDTWIDWKSIPKGEDWEQEIYRGIEEADAFLFLISPDSVASQMCNLEVTHAVKNGKRILPIFISSINVDEVNKGFYSETARSEILKRNWIFCRNGQDDFGNAIEVTRETIHTDYKWLKYHTELQVKAIKWVQKKDNSRLLRGKELREAEQQLSEISSQRDPQPTKVQREYVLASQRNEVRLRRQITISLSFGLMLMVLLSVFAWAQRNQSVALATQLTQISQSSSITNTQTVFTPQATIATNGQLGVSSQSVTILTIVFTLILIGIIYIVSNVRNRSVLPNRELKGVNTRIKLKVFLCHASKDKPEVRKYYDRLKKEKEIDPWLDVEKLLPGTDWDLEIKSTVKSSDVVLVFLSKYSVNREGYVQKEIRQALDVADEKPDGTIFIIPLRLEDCDVPERLKRWHWLDLFEADSYDKLLTSLRKRSDNLAIKNAGVQ